MPDAISGVPASLSPLSLGPRWPPSWRWCLRVVGAPHAHAVRPPTCARPAAIATPWLSGIRVNRVLVSVYVLCGIGAALLAYGGVALERWLSRAGDSTDAVAAVVVGGTALRAGIDLGHARGFFHRHPQQWPEPL